MSIKEELYRLALLFYGPREGFPGKFYIPERSPLFPPVFPPMQGQLIGKGSFYQSQSVESHSDSVTIDIDVNVVPYRAEQSGDSGQVEFVYRQRDIFTWDSCGNVNVLVDYPDSEGKSLAQLHGQLIKFNEDQLVFDFISTPVPCPPLSDQPWKDQVASCRVKVMHTDTLINTNVEFRGTVYSYDMFYIEFLDAENTVLGNQMVEPSGLGLLENPFMSSSTNPFAWGA